MPKSTRGGRRSGASGGGGGGIGPGVNIPNQPGQPQSTPPQPGNQPASKDVAVLAAEYNNADHNKGDYTGNNNPGLLKWQAQQDMDKAANYLGKLGKSTITQDDPKYQFYNNTYQKFIHDMGLNDKPIEMNANDFNAYVAATGQDVIYRGWSSTSSMNRLTDSDYTHTGCGMYGEGIYLGDRSVARQYGSTLSTCALAPSARVISITALRQQMPSGGKIASALYKSGHDPNRSNFRPNDGEAHWALKMGYNVIDAGWCKVALTRDVLVVKK